VVVFKKPPKKKISSTMTEEELKTFFDSSDVVPANLRRKVDAKRPTLGHVVPFEAKEFQKKAQRQQQRRATGGSGGPRLRPQGKARQEGINNPSNLKILGGKARGKRLSSPDVFLRPMMGKVREAVYSTITSFGLYDPSNCDNTHHLDIFAGSGSVGLESLSRGAATCTFVDLAPGCCDSVHRNLEGCGFDEAVARGESQDSSGFTKRQNQVVCADALQALNNPDNVGISTAQNHKFQVVTLCPPYEEVVYGDLVHAVANSPLVEEDTIIVLEYPIELGCLPHVYKRDDGGALIGIRNRRYGRTVIAMYIVNPTGRLELASSRPEEFVSI
jgi:16S rRNA (guanine966-N2)-methyltransferase